MHAPTLKLLLLAALCLLTTSVAADEEKAQDEEKAANAAPPTAAPRPGPPLGWLTELGVGTIVNPESVGSDDYQILPIPYFDFRYLDERGTRFFANVPQGIGGYFYRQRSTKSARRLNVGASIAPGFNVRDDIDGLEEVDPAIEARLIVEAGGRHWGAQMTLAQDLGTGHEGAYLDLGLTWRDQLGSRGGFYSVGPMVRLVDDDYNNALFSVSPAEAVASGLPAYEADGGIERAGVQALVALPVGTSRWRWTTVTRFSRLLGDAADSPVVSEENQFFFLTSLTRRF